MKKICCAVLVALGLMLPNAVKAADLTGLYVAPKFVLNVQHAKGTASAENWSGLSFSKHDTDVSAGGAIAFGYNFAPKFNVPVRAELEYGAYGELSTFVDTGDLISGTEAEATVGVQTLLANVYWDITTWNDFTPYVGAGIGVAFVKTECQVGLPEFTNITAGRSHTETVFAGQIGFGCSYAFTENISADLGYRFLMMDDGDVSASILDMNGTLEATDNYAHQLMLGLRLTF